MAKYKISHPQLPQLRAILHLPEGVQPSEKHFWEAAKTMVRPYGASQLTDKSKIIAYRNGFFDSPSTPIFDQEDDPNTLQSEEQQGILSSLMDLTKEGLRRVSTGSSPHEKVNLLGSKLDIYNRKIIPQDYSTDNFSEQLKKAGKITFGNLDNMVPITKVDDVVARSLNQVGLKPTKSNRAKAIKAARDYSEGNIKASLGMGVVRAQQTGQFVKEGLPYLTNKMLMDEADDSDVLDFVNSSISFDKLMYESENAAKLAAFAMDNPLESIKASASGVVGGVVQSAPLGSTLGVDSKSIQDRISNKDSLSFDSQLQQDLSTGYQEPSEGLSLLTEVVADPLNLAGAPVAKAVTSPLRIGLKGRMLKTITDVQKNTTRLAQLQTVLKKLPEGARVTQGIVKGQIVKVTEELAEQQKILQKYGSNSLTLRLAGQASPETLGKVAMDTLDQSTEAGMIGMGLVREATKASDKMSKLRRVANVAAKYNPEVAGATVGAMIAGPGGAVVGAALPSLIKALRVLSAMPENMAIRSIITANKNAGMEISEQVARQRYKSGMNQLSGFLGVTSATGFALDQDSLGGGAGIAALTTFLGPKTLSLVDNITRDARVIGSELTLARTGDHTPFFRRLAMLPTPDEGLIGANTDKFNILMRAAPEGFFARKVDAVVQGFKASKIDASPSPQAFRRGPQGEAIGQAPTISGATRSVANFLDKPGAVGRLGTPIEVLGRFSKGMAAGASIPTTIGYIASGGQASGAIAGVAMSAPFTALGSGAGMYQNYKTKGDLYAKQIGDVQYYREHLTKPEQAEFDALPANIRAQIAGYSLSHPDVVFKQTTQGEGGFDPVNMEVTYNPNGTEYLKGTMAHEITHFMEIHGLTPMVNRILFGDELTGMAGEFASYDSDGKIVYTDEFIKLRDIYMDKLRKDVSLDSQEAIDAVTAYESDPKLIGREIFADQGADFLLSGKREKALNQGPFGKLVGATIDGITGVSFLRDFLLKLNLPLNSEGKFITSTGLFDGKLRKIPELQNLIEKYYKDVRGLKKAQIEGEKVTDPLTKRTRETKGARPIDDEFDTLYTVEDQKDPNVVDRLNTGGIFKTNPTTGEVERDSLKNPIRMTKGEADDISQAAGDHAAKVFEKNGIEVEINDKGRPFVKDLGALTEDIIDQLAKGPIHPRQIAALREISRALRQGDGERAGMLLGYYAATQGRKPKAVSFAIRTTMPYGFELTAQGNILVRLHDNKQIQRNLKFLKGELQAKKLPDELVGMYDDLFGNDNAVWDAFETYRNNTSNGIDGRTGLDPDPVKADKKLNFLNALHGGIDKAHVAKNPVLSAIGWKMAGINQKRSPFGPATKTFRLDRIFDAKRSGTASGFNLERAKNLMAPQGQKLMMPQMELDFSPPKATQSLESKPNFWEIYRINPKGPKVYDEVADVLIQVGSPWMDGSIIESQAPLLGLEKGKLRQAMDRAHRRADRGGGKMFMPAAYHGTPHTFKAEEGAPLGKFKSSQIGTGEGAQAYGHGLYFAGKKEVAEHYRKVLTQDERGFYDGQPYNSRDPRHQAALDLENFGDREALIGYYERRAKRMPNADRSDLVKVLRDKTEAKKTPPPKGSLYKVELAPKENEYLLWDKPLSEQPKAVREKVEKGSENFDDLVGYSSYKEMIDAGGLSRLFSNDGGSFYDTLSRELGGPKASAALKEAGIPGIKYLDGASRGKGKGDFNYVIFDDSDVTITEKLFMPASEAGASKGKLAEAAKLWNEKGTDSPYFKNWFGKSKVVDENGEPLVVYHGTSDKFTAFDADRYQTINKGDFGEGFYFTPKKGQARLYSQDAIKKTDPEVLALQKEYEAQAKQLGTSTMMAAIDLGLNSPEYKKLQQFESKLDQKLQSINKGNDEIIIDSYLSLENPLIVKSTSASDPFLAQSAKERGHDGIIVKFDNGRIDEIVAFSPEQIKSATGNRGTFDAGEGNILFMPASEAKNKLKDLEASAKKDPLDSPSRNHLIQASLLEGIINESQGGAELDIRIGKHEGGEGSTYIEYIGEDGDAFKIRATDHDRQLSSITNHRRPDFTLASNKKNVSESSGDWIDAIVKLENKTDFRVPKRLEDRIKSIISRREEIQKLNQEIATQESLQREQASKAIEDAKLKATGTLEGKALSDEIDAIRLELQNSSGTGKYTRNQRQSMYKKVRKLEKQLEGLGRGEVNFMPSDPKAPKAQPTNRVQQQAQSMPANRFMAPASMAKGELSERFR